MIVAAGLFNLAIALFHVVLGHILGWPERLEVLDRGNRAAMRFFNNALIILLAAIGIAFVVFTPDIVSTTLGQFLVAAMLVFWLVRLVFQPVYLGWTSRSSRTAMAILTAGVLLHVGALWRAFL